MNNDHTRHTWRTTPFVCKRSIDRYKLLGPWDLQPGQEMPSPLRGLRTMLQILGINLRWDYKIKPPKAMWYWPWSVATIPQIVTTAAKRNFGPIFLRRRLAGRSVAIYGLAVLLRLLYNILEHGVDVHEKNDDTGLILSISQMKILLEASNSSVSCIWY